MYMVAADLRPAGGRVRPAQCCQPLTSHLSDVLNMDLHQLHIFINLSLVRKMLPTIKHLSIEMIYS